MRTMGGRTQHCFVLHTIYAFQGILGQSPTQSLAGSGPYQGLRDTDRILLSPCTAHFAILMLAQSNPQHLQGGMPGVLPSAQTAHTHSAQQKEAGTTASQSQQSQAQPRAIPSSYAPVWNTAVHWSSLCLRLTALKDPLVLQQRKPKVSNAVQSQHW